MELARKIFRFLSSVLFYSVVLVLGIALLMFVASFIDKKISMKNGISRSPLFGAYIIISESMIPNINVYDAVVTIRVGQDKIKVDDIITFISKEIETQGTPITHRVVGIVYEDENKEKVLGYRTKGDHNNTQDFALIAPDEVLGKVYLRIPMIGYLQTFMTNPIGWLLIVVIPCLLIIGSDILKLIRNSKQNETLLLNENVNVPADIETNLEEEGKQNVNTYYENQSNIDNTEKNSIISSFSNDEITQSISDSSNTTHQDISNSTTYSIQSQYYHNLDSNTDFISDVNSNQTVSSEKNSDVGNSFDQDDEGEEII